jgi:quaternary ammonium compound-resistance protein SugE
MAWIQLLVAAVFEIGWAIGLKYSQGFTRFWPSVFTIAAMLASFTLLALAVRTIPVGTGYAVWTGIGAVGTALLGIVLFSEPVTVLRIVCLILIVSGVIGLKYSGSTVEASRPAASAE